VRTLINLSAIDADALLKAIDQFNTLGRARFLRKYDISRSSKFYLFHGERLYDTKALVASAYYHGTGRRLPRHRFGGGPQTTNVIRRVIQQDPEFHGSKVFEDTFGELRNLSAEYDRLSKPYPDVQKLGFSKWIALSNFDRLNTGALPGIYVVADSERQPTNLRLLDPSIVYVGETVLRTLSKRLYELNRSLGGNSAHSGGDTLLEKEYRANRLWLSIRSFPLRYGMPDELADPLRSSLIRFLERMLLLEYVLKNGRYPAGNSK
jgi:hypothetical protein